jgi:hypothetical protein
MTTIRRILLALFAWVLALAPGSPLATFNIFLVGVHAYADTNVLQSGSNGDYGENGGDVVLLDVASGGADNLGLSQYAYGGSGGNGDNSSAPGQGGFASSFLSGLSLGASSTSYFVSASGGWGGYALSGSAVDGGHGGDARAGFSLIGAGDISGVAWASGGGGGGTYGSGNCSTGGQGTLGTVYGESTSGGAVNVTGQIFGGRGGDSGSTYGGNGGSGRLASLTNAVDGNTTGNLTLSQFAGGGSGGNVYYGGTGGLGGSAESRLNVSKSVNSLSLLTVASGGDGGNYYYSNSNLVNGGNGGGAIAYTDATNTNTAIASANASGGYGGLGLNGGNAGQGGAALATAQATSTSSDVQSNASASGGQGGDIYDGSNNQGGKGGDAVATAAGNSGGLLHTDNTISSFASGGSGGSVQSGTGSGGDGGCATAMATGTSLGQLYVDSYASGGQGGIVYSGYGSSGKSGDALATSTGTALSGSVSSYATCNLGNGYASASAPILNSTSTSVAGANVAQPIKNLADAQGSQAVAFGTALPSNNIINTLLNQNPAVLSTFNGGSTVLGYGVLGGAATSNSDYGTYNSSLSYNLDIKNLSNSLHLTLGLLGSSFTGTDFSNMEFSIYNQSQQLFDKTFGSAAQAKSFFSNNVLDLGSLGSIASGGSGLNLTFNYNITAANNSASYFNFIYGTPTTSSPPPPPTLVTLANLCNQVSQTGTNGWDIYTSLPISPPNSGHSYNGFKAVAYATSDKSQIVIAFRGTVLDVTNPIATLKNVCSDSSFVSGVATINLRSSVEDAAKFVSDVVSYVKSQNPGANITLTGHSLGGAIAQLIGEKSGLTTYAFNAPGAEQVYSQLSNELSYVDTLSANNPNINYRIWGDQVSLAGTPIGQTTTLEAPSSLTFVNESNSIYAAVTNLGDSLSAHSIQIFSQLDNHPLPTATQIGPNNVSVYIDALKPIAGNNFTLGNILISSFDFQFILLDTSLHLLDPVAGTNFIFTADAGSPRFRSLILPSLTGVSFYMIRFEEDNIWTNFQALQPGEEYFLGTGAYGIEFQPFDQDGNPLTLPDGFLFGLSFDSIGTFSGTLTTTSPVPLPSSLLLLGPGLLSLAGWRRFRRG